MDASMIACTVLPYIAQIARLLSGVISCVAGRKSTIFSHELLMVTGKVVIRQ
jgi:hypothetical protein